MKTLSYKSATTRSILALGMLSVLSLPAQAADLLDPPGNYDYRHWYRHGTSVPADVTRPAYTNGTSAIKLGDDYAMVGRPIERVWAKNLPTDAFGYRANDKYGMLVFSASSTTLGCSNSCPITLQSATQKCQEVQLQWGVDVSASLPSVGDASMNYQSTTTQQLCLNNTATWGFTAGYYDRYVYIQALSGVEYRYARMLISTKAILFRSSIVSAATTDAKLIAAHALCLSQGWESGSSQRNNITYFKQTIAAGGNKCSVPNAYLQHYVYGPHPDDGVYSESYSTNRVVAGNFVTSYDPVDVN